jgi:hypothetical protein
LKKSMICCALTLLTVTTAPADDKRSIAAARAAVLGVLKDPSSSRFEGEIVYPTGAVCGLVNAKNAYGGYVGSTVYLYVLATKEVVFLTMTSDYSDNVERYRMVDKYCSR